MNLPVLEHLRAFNCRELQDPKCAADALRLVLKMDPSIQDARRDLAQIQAGYGDFDLAYTDARRYMNAEKDPDFELTFKEYAKKTTKPIDMLLSQAEPGFSAVWPKDVDVAFSQRSPEIRVGLFSTAEGEPQRLSEATVMGSAQFDVTLLEEGTLAQGRAREVWKILFTAKPAPMVVILQGSKEFRIAKPAIFQTSDSSKGSFLIKGARPMGLSEALSADIQVRGNLLIIPQTLGFRLINAVGLEEYLLGVLPYEIGAASPSDTLKAQAVLARSYALWRKNTDHAHNQGEGLFDVCDQVHCQVYKGLLGETKSGFQAVKDTFGENLLDNGRPFRIWYHASCGGVLSDGAKADREEGVRPP